MNVQLVRKPMAADPMKSSLIAQIDRRIEDAVGRIMRGEANDGDYGLVSDLSAQRVEMTEPKAFAAIEELLGVRIPA